MTRARISYTNRDYESMRRELLARIPQLTDRWTDFNETDLGIVLLELFCGVGDMLAYYMDAQANEAFLPTVRQRGNLINLLKLISYRLKGTVSSTTELRFSLAAALDENLTIPMGTVCRAAIDGEEIDFVTATALVIEAGEIAGTVAARQGKPRSEEFVGSGQPRQPLELRGKEIAHGSLRVFVDGIEWNEVWHFQESEAESAHFLPETDGLDRTAILFGDGKRGMIPPQGSPVRVEYLETLGADGNLAPGLIREVVTPILVRGVPVRLSVTNPIAATGGEGAQSMDDARHQAPAELRSLWKAVTREDYQALALGFPGVAKARLLDVNDCSHIRYYQVNLAIAPAGGGRPSPLLMGELQSFLESRKVITIEIRLFEPSYRPVDINAEVFAFGEEDPEYLRRRVEEAIRGFFAFVNVDFGMGVYFSDLVALIDGVAGVSRVRLRHPATDLEIGPGEIPVLGELLIDIRRATG